ncbi:MAG: hypothetical protein AAGI22_24180 [Planctomycetota bacterium]
MTSPSRGPTSGRPSLHALLVAALLAGACGGQVPGDDAPDPPVGDGGIGPLVSRASLDAVDLGPQQDEIVDLDPRLVHEIVADVFARYAALVAPSGARIHVLAQTGVPDAKIRRAREVLRLHLTDRAGSDAGASKADVANLAASRCGTLALFTDSGSYDPTEARVARFDSDFGTAYVPLFADRVVVEGTADYVAPSPAWDQTFGATAVLVHRHGLVPLRPTWETRLRAALASALTDGTYLPFGPHPYRTVEEAYLGALLESHAGVWAHDPSGDGSAQFGVYAFGSRPALAAGDASTHALIEDFFSPVHAFDSVLDPTFAGEFELASEPGSPYTHRSQYLSRVTLSGSSIAALLGSERSDVLTGNGASNAIEGRGGNDVIDGGGGVDAVVYQAPQAEFTLLPGAGGTTTVRHDVSPGLGQDVVRNVELLVFTDGVVQL